VSQSSEVTALLLCGKYKTAYLSAVKAGNIGQVLTIKREAERTSDIRTAQLCATYLKKKGQIASDN